MAAALQEALRSGQPADTGTEDRHICARGLGLLGRGRQVSWLGRTWAAVWSSGGTADPARRVVLAGSALAADGLPILCLLAASGCAGDAGEAAAATSRLCRQMAARADLPHRLRCAMRGVAASLASAARRRPEAVRELRHRVGWLACLGLARSRFYDGQMRSALPDARKAAVAAEVALRLRPERDLRAPHLHMAAWLASLAQPVPAVPSADSEVASKVGDLIGEAQQMLGQELGPPRELALLLSALGSRRGLHAEPARYLGLLQNLLPSSAVQLVKHRGAEQVVAGSGSLPCAGAVPAETADDLRALVSQVPPHLLGQARELLRELVSSGA